MKIMKFPGIPNGYSEAGESREFPIGNSWWPWFGVNLRLNMTPRMIFTTISEFRNC